MFYVRYLAAELRRRKGRTLLTSLGLAVGVGFVVVVGALSNGLDEAQRAVLEPLTGVGTDLSVSRPITVPDDERAGGAQGDPFSRLSAREQRLLQEENEQHNQQFNFADLGEPGERFSRDSFLSTKLSFPTSEVSKVRSLDGARDAAAALTLNALHVEGTVPESGAPPIGAGAHAGGGAAPRGGFRLETQTVAGIDVTKPALAAVTPDQISKGRYFSSSPQAARDEALVDLAVARRMDLGVGDAVTIAGNKLEIVGLASAPLGGDAANVYLELRRLQRLSDREGRVNEIRVRADTADAVAGLADDIVAGLAGADVVTATDLADRVGGSLADADDLSAKLGTALAIVALLAAFLIATLLSLSSVHKRTRELGTLKALGWRQRLVVRQVAAESLVQGALGGLLGAAIAVAAAAVVDAAGPTLEASVQARSGGGFGPFGQGTVTSGSTDVVVGAPLDPGLLALAIGLSIVGGLVAGGAGGLRAARLRPADALRSVE